VATELTDGDILLYTLVCEYQGQRILNTWHLKVTQFTPDNIDYEDAATAILTELSGLGDLIDQLEAITVNAYNYVEHRIQRVWPTRNRTVVQLLGTSGTLLGTGSTVNQAAVVTKYGNVATRYGIGSWHQCGLPASYYTTTGRIDPSAVTALTAAVAMLTAIGDIEGFAGTEASPVLWSHLVPARVTPIQQVVGQSTARVMRRRTVGVGI